VLTASTTARARIAAEIHARRYLRLANELQQDGWTGPAAAALDVVRLFFQAAPAEERRP
jgi:hypothetical protein